MYESSHKPEPEPKRLVHFNLRSRRSQSPEKQTIHSCQAIPQEGFHLPERSTDFDREPFHYLCDQLKDSSPSDQVVFPDPKRKSRSDHRQRKQMAYEGDRLSDHSESLHSPLRRSRDSSSESASSERRACQAECHPPVQPVEPESPETMGECPEFVHAPFHRLRLQLKESGADQEKNLQGLAAVTEMESKQGPRAARLPQQGRRRSRPPSPTPPPPLAPPALPHPPQLPRDANPVSVNCNSCVINYNYVPPTATRYTGLIVCEIAVVIAFAFFAYLFRKV